MSEEEWTSGSGRYLLPSLDAVLYDASQPDRRILVVNDHTSPYVRYSPIGVAINMYMPCNLATSMAFLNDDIPQGYRYMRLVLEPPRPSFIRQQLVAWDRNPCNTVVRGSVIVDDNHTSSGGIHT